jgi:LPS-assembly protein
VPYFLNIADDRDLTITPKLYLNENPLMLAEYRQDFKNSSLIVDAGYTAGYKKKDNKKTSGGRSHFFANFNKNLIDEKEIKSNLLVKVEKVSNDTYFKIHDIETALVDKNKSALENSLNYTYQNNDFYFDLTPSVYEDTNKKGNLRYEYLLPLTIEKNILSSSEFGFVDFASNLKIRSFDTNKQINLLVNDFNWKSNNWMSKLGFENYFEGLIKTVNYDAKKTKNFKNENSNSELNSALGFFGKLPLYKNDISNKNFHSLTPKFLLRYAPGHMRNIENDGKLNYGNLFSLNKINQIDVVESGLSASLGFEYKKKKLDKENNVSNEVFSFSAGQVVRDKENMDIPSRTSLDQRFSDLVGKANYNVGNKIKLNYNFALDQNYKELNYSEIGTDFNFESAKFNVSYLQEKNHIGNQEYVQSGIDYKLNNSTELSFNTKRNLLTSSAEFYNLSYNYINDCLKAGIAYRREFYTDRDIEPSNTLMFTISIVPFAVINSPALSR